MSVFVDTGVLYAHHDTDATRHEVGVAALTRVLQSAEYGRAMTSDYVYDEVVTLTQRRTGDVAAGVEVGRRIRGDGSPRRSNSCTPLQDSSRPPSTCTRPTLTRDSVSPTR